MGKYRKLPVEVEAFQLGMEKLPEWFMNSDAVDLHYEEIIDDETFERVNGITEVHINTLEGRMKADFYDYIIKGVNGEIYPCKPDIFEKTYEKVEEI